MTDKIERTKTGDELVCKMVELDTLSRVMFETDTKIQKLRGEINVLMEQLRKEKGLDDGSNGEKK